MNSTQAKRVVTTAGRILLREGYPATLILMLTINTGCERILHALCADASGCRLKNAPPARLQSVFEETADNGAPMSPEIAHRVITSLSSLRAPEDSEEDLTPHEVRLLQLLADGHNYKTAAAALGVSSNTIAFHMKHIYEKLDVHSKAEAVAKALRCQLVN